MAVGCLLGRQCRSYVGQTAAQITGNQENENAKGMKNRSEKNEKTEPEQKRNDNFQTKKMMIKMKKNETIKKHDFQSLAGWDEHKDRGIERSEESFEDDFVECIYAL